jgi:Ca2+-binding RTX toxin-like protein
MKRNHALTPLSLGYLALFAWGCAAPVAPDPVGGESNASAGSDSRGGGTGSRSSGSGGGGNEPDPIDTLPGVDAPLEEAPDGCLGGFADGALNLSLDGAIPSVIIEGLDDKVVVNGNVCTATDGADVSLASVALVRVTGTSEQENAVILDLAAGDWSELLASAESIALDLGSDKNSLVVRGTSGPDHFHHGMRGQAVVMGLLGDGTINVVGEGVTQLGVSLGAGDDRLDDLGILWAARNAEAAAAAPAPGAEAVEPTLPVLALSLPLAVKGGDGNDWLLGGSGPDEFDGGPSDDVMNGLTGDDTLRASVTSDGADTFNGGTGYDDVTYELRTENLTLNVCQSAGVMGCEAGECDCTRMSGVPEENDRLVNVEDVTGGEGDDVVRGSDLAESLSGGPGDDEIYGLGGSDVLYGQRGNDLFDGGPDGDYCDDVSGEMASGCEL